MVRGSAPSAAPNSTVPVASESTNSTTSVPPAPSSGSSGISDAATLFPRVDLGALSGSGVSRLFGTGLPEFEQVQQQLTQNPNMMREIINSPAIQSLMNNPEIMRSLIMSNPQMREIIDRNPELAHILNDPGVLRQTLEAARNPELMREMTRNTDRAMSNIESSPEGFNMLRRMYENVQEPFLNATTMDAGAGADVVSNPFAALLRNQDATQTRDGSNSANTGPEMASGTTVPNTNPLPNPWSNSGSSQTNNAARTNSTDDTRLPSIPALGGLGVPELERMGMPDSSAFSRLLQNPAMEQMMQSFLSNSQHMDQILSLNPQLRAVLDVNPQLREMMQNPEIVRELTSPETMQQMMALQQQLSQLSQQQSTTGGVQTGHYLRGGVQTGQGRGIENNMGLDMLMNMLGGLGAGSLTASNAPDVTPDELYSTQLSQLQEMGFFDTEENIRALRATSGNVHAAVERLLGNPSR